MSFNAEPAPNDRPFFSDLKKHGSTNMITLGTGSYVEDIEIGYFLDNSNPPNILIGRFCSLADKIYFSIGGNHPYKNVSSFPFDSADVLQKIFVDNNAAVKPLPYNKRPNHFQVIIGHDVWIGYGVTVMGGVKIGTGAIIGANAVVAKDIPPYAIVVGNPARVVKYRFDAATIKKFLAVKWWNWSIEKIADNVSLMDDVEKFLAAHYTPALAEISEDNIGRQIASLRTQGRKIYNFIADFGVEHPL